MWMAQGNAFLIPTPVLLLDEEVGIAWQRRFGGES